jgi:hypothetical protein
VVLSEVVDGRAQASDGLLQTLTSAKRGSLSARLLRCWKKEIRTIQPPIAPLIKGRTFFSKLCAKLIDVLGILRIERLKTRRRLMEMA